MMVQYCRFCRKSIAAAFEIAPRATAVFGLRDIPLTRVISLSRALLRQLSSPSLVVRGAAALLAANQLQTARPLA
jgi:hypothetical protein